ncbi:M48 family metallopeptidase [uncultured Alsobacter sp.]|uniref:M48 family metallopeptidase n=1 Tax=uncultured Alsobacter sp. TaxID=1748258 RepID=UPI0025F5F3F6|nr:M48 family metallopeptidase [uncultured Alsobacter sp.]
MSDPGQSQGLRGRFFAQGATTVRNAVLRREAGTLIVDLGDGERRAAPTIAEVSERVGRIPVQIRFSDGSAFEVPWDADLAVLGHVSGAHEAVLNRVERNWMAVAAATVGLVLTAAALYVWGVPAAARGLAAVTPAAVVTAIDAASRETFERSILQPTTVSQARQDQLRSAFADMLDKAGYQGPPPRLLFASAPSIGANAFALPGGTVLVTDGLLTLASTDDEILGVLAHEAGHVQARHGLRQLYAALGIYVVMGMIGGDPGHLADTVATQAGALQMLSYSRDFEREADRYGVAAMKAAGRDPLALARILGRLGKQDDSSLWSSHPDTAERRAEIERLAKEP